MNIAKDQSMQTHFVAESNNILQHWRFFQSLRNWHLE